MIQNARLIFARILNVEHAQRKPNVIPFKSYVLSM
jgi:hypothetical protein